VLDAALEIAAVEGIPAITMGAISARMGVSRPVVYDCYNGRGEVLKALLDRETDVALNALLAILPPLKTTSVEQMFVDGFRSLLDDVKRRPASWRIIFANDPDPVLTEAISRGRRRIADQVDGVMRPLFERWKIGEIDRVAPVLTEIFLSICETAARTTLEQPDAWSPDALADIFGRAAYRAVRARGG
jgi:AcrR family transcriptional regulator